LLLVFGFFFFFFFFFFGFLGLFWLVFRLVSILFVAPPVAFSFGSKKPPAPKPQKKPKAPKQSAFTRGGPQGGARYGRGGNPKGLGKGGVMYHRGGGKSFDPDLEEKDEEDEESEEVEEPKVSKGKTPAKKPNSYGAPKKSTTAFGAQPSSAFGAQPSSAFGAPTTSTAFGAQPSSAFGAQPSSAFGAPTTSTAFGAQPSSAFGAPTTSTAFAAPNTYFGAVVPDPQPYSFTGQTASFALNDPNSFPGFANTMTSASAVDQGTSFYALDNYKLKAERAKPATNNASSNFSSAATSSTFGGTASAEYVYHLRIRFVSFLFFFSSLSHS
jgi:hypothetical protein